MHYYHYILFNITIFNMQVVTENDYDMMDTYKLSKQNYTQTSYKALVTQG